MPHHRGKDARTWGAVEDGALVTFHGAGKSLRQSALAMGWAPTTVSKHSRRLGLGWDRSQLAVAHVAHKRDMQAMKAQQAQEAMMQAAEVLQCFRGPFLVFNFGGKDNTYEEHHLQSPPTQDMRNLAQTWAILTKGAQDLQATAVDDAEDAKSMLVRLAESLGIEERQSDEQPVGHTEPTVSQT